MFHDGRVADDSSLEHRHEVDHRIRRADVVDGPADDGATSGATVDREHKTRCHVIRLSWSDPLFGIRNRITRTMGLLRLIG